MVGVVLCCEVVRGVVVEEGVGEAGIVLNPALDGFAEAVVEGGAGME